MFRGTSIVETVSVFVAEFPTESVIVPVTTYDVVAFVEVK